MGEVYRVGDLVEMRVHGDFNKRRGVVLYPMPDDIHESCFIELTERPYRGFKVLVLKDRLRKIWMHHQVERSAEDPGPASGRADAYYTLLFLMHNNDRLVETGFDCLGVEGEDFGFTGMLGGSGGVQ